MIIFQFVLFSYWLFASSGCLLRTPSDWALYQTASYTTFHISIQLLSHEYSYLRLYFLMSIKDSAHWEIHHYTVKVQLSTNVSQFLPNELKNDSWIFKSSWSPFGLPFVAVSYLKLSLLWSSLPCRKQRSRTASCNLFVDLYSRILRSYSIWRMIQQYYTLYIYPCITHKNDFIKL